MDGWKKLVAGALLGVAGTIYATDEEARRNLPRRARDFPEDVRRRFKDAVSAGREASSSRRQEILRDLEGHGGGGLSSRPRRDGVDPEPDPQSETDQEPGAYDGGAARTPELPLDTSPDATEPIDSDGLRDAVDRERRSEGA